MWIVTAWSPPRLVSHVWLVPFRDAHLVSPTFWDSIIGASHSGPFPRSNCSPPWGITKTEFSVPSQAAYDWSVLKIYRVTLLNLIKLKFLEYLKEWRMDVKTRDHLRFPIHAILMHDPLRPFSFGSTAPVEYESPLCADDAAARFYIPFFPGGFPVPELSCSLTLRAMRVLPPTSREEEPLIVWFNDRVGCLTGKAVQISREKKNQQVYLSIDQTKCATKSAVH